VKKVVLDSFIVSATPYEILRSYYADGNWTHADIAKRHILFPEDLEGGGYCSTFFDR
jgi:hypothetical protein